jgi:transposase
MEPQVKMRLGWIEHYQKSQNLSLTSRRCGISCLTLMKWLHRFRQQGVAELSSRSRRPLRCPHAKVTADHCDWIRVLRQRRLGPRRIQSELEHHHQLHLSTATIYGVLGQDGYTLLKTNRRPRKKQRRYQKEIPGERVQMEVCRENASLRGESSSRELAQILPATFRMDVCKIAPKLYQFTARKLAGQILCPADFLN